jgi:hypothetical protein
MKKLAIILLLGIPVGQPKAQSFEIEQLALDVQKLAQLKNILTDLYKGYQILDAGYTAIKDISQGNFNLHKAFLDGLLLASPVVRNATKVAGIITNQASLVSEYQSALRRFRQDPHFTPGELVYLGQVYGNLFSESLKNITNLTNILTAGTLRMSDDERLHAIDGIYARSQDQLMFLRGFNSGTTMLAVQRAAEDGDVATINSLYGLK